MKEKIMKVEELEIDDLFKQCKIWNRRIYDENWTKIQQTKIEK
jgi:hypothetical protein